VAEPSLASPHHEGRPLLAVFSATFFVRFAFGITVAVLYFYITGHSGGSAQQAVGTTGAITALSPVGEFSTVLLSGAAADRYGRFPVLFTGIGAAALIFVLISLTRDPAQLAAANFGYGIASGAILASSLGIVADASGVSERGFEMGRFDAMNLSGWIAGYACGFAVEASVPNASLGAAFLVGAAILVSGLGFAAILLRGRPVARGSTSFALREVVTATFRRSVLLVTLPWFVIYSLIGTALLYFSPASSSIGVPKWELAVIIGVGGLLLVVTQPLFGRFADRFGRIRMMSVGATGFVLVMLFASLIVAYGPAVPLLVGVGASVLLALVYGPAALAALTDLSHQVGRATSMAIYSMTISAGMLVGLFASSQLYSRLGNTGLYFFFGALGIGLAALTAARIAELRGQAPDRATTPAR